MAALPQRSIRPGFQALGPQGLVEVACCTLGPFQTNCYLVRSGGRAWVVDASFGSSTMVEILREQDLTPEALLLTHAHVDHIAGVEDVRRAFVGVPVAIHADERAWLEDPQLNLSNAMGLPVHARPAERTLRDGDTLTLCASSWRVLHLPGHSPGSVGFWCEAAGVIISGDALFAGSIGRTDFPGSDFDTLASSIRTKLYTLPPETLVLPGHGPSTTIGEEMRSNPYVPAR